MSDVESSTDVSSADFSQKSFFRRLNDFLFGYDYFISYAWADGRTYAVKLAEELEKHHLECFLDSDDYAKGDDWKAVGQRALRKTSRLILVGSPKSLESKPVLREIEIYTSRGRHVIPISFDGSLAADRSSSTVLQHITPDILRIEEPSRTLTDGPSDSVVDDLVNTFQILTQQQKRTRFALAVAAVFLIVITGAVVVWRSERNKTLAAALVDRLIDRKESSYDLRKELAHRAEAVVNNLKGGSLIGPQLREAEKRVVIGEQRAASASALIHLGYFDEAIQFLRCPTEDPETLTQFAALCKERENIDRTDLIRVLQDAHTQSLSPSNGSADQMALICYGVLLALGEYKDTPLDPKFVQQTLVPWYRDHPNAAVHSAIGWLLREYGHMDEVERLDAELAISSDALAPLESMKRDWFVVRAQANADETAEPVCLTFVRFGLGTFEIGSPEGEEGRTAVLEGQTSMTIERMFAICDRELTWLQWKRLFDKEAAVPTPGQPVHGVSQEQAKEFCRELSASLPTSYEVRLPSEVEWEYVCRHGTVTPFNFGSDMRLFRRYGWARESQKNESQQTPVQPGGTPRPSTAGLFDIHGNASEWTNNTLYPYDDPSRTSSRPVTRGGHIGEDMPFHRSAARSTSETNAGLRVLLVHSP